MPVSAWCSSGLVVTTALTLLLLPAQYFVPEYQRPGAELAPAAPVAAPAAAGAAAYAAWSYLQHVHFPTLDLVFTVLMLLLGLFIYLCEWIQRKLMERRMLKLNQYLGASVERLRAWDAKQEKLESTLKVVQNATSEYNLLLYLMLQHHRLAGAAPPPHTPHPPANCYYDKELNDALNVF